MVFEAMVAMSLCAGSNAPVPTRTAMLGGFEALTTLVWLTSPGAPQKGQDEVIKLELKKLEALPHAFETAKLRQQEPGMSAIAGLFKGYVARTRARYEAGDVETVGFRVRTLSGLCFACHTREAVPADFADAEKRFESLALPPLDRAQALAATRQFDRALTLYRDVLLAPETPYRELSRGLEDALTVLVRVKNDPVAALALLDEVAERKDLPQGARTQLDGWRKELTAWKSDPFEMGTSNADQLLEKGEALVKEDTDVALLRASSYVSRALTLKANHPKRAQALWLLGVSAGRVRSPLLWDLDLLYFEACVRENPKKRIAKQCFESFRDRLVLGFSGSSGTHVPADEQARLDQLQKLAGVK